MEKYTIEADYSTHIRRFRLQGRKIQFKINAVPRNADPVDWWGREDSKFKMYLLYHEGYSNVIKSLMDAFCCSYFCEKCRIPYNNRGTHRCQATCSGYRNSPPCEKSNGGRSVCEEVHRCISCLKTVPNDRKQTHVCGEFYCKICRSFERENHLCYIQRQLVSNSTRRISVLKQFCDVCIGKSEIQIACIQFGVRQVVMRNTLVENFLQFILNQRQILKQLVCIAHNGQGFDFQFIPNYIIRGTKIVLLTYQNLKLIDSVNNFSLAKLQKSFGLAEGVKKGMFPHLFNNRENQF
ncbi:hypothetical protein JTB14_026265 [Gonioctena quinquepunctata]|nr:hypothetical protein JTB14_026265 [Gonioctena quinquepunctata]